MHFLKPLRRTSKLRFMIRSLLPRRLALNAPVPPRFLVFRPDLQKPSPFLSQSGDQIPEIIHRLAKNRGNIVIQKARISTAGSSEQRGGDADRLRLVKVLLPFTAEEFRLLHDGFGGLLLLVGRVAVLARGCA